METLHETLLVACDANAKTHPAPQRNETRALPQAPLARAPLLTMPYRHYLIGQLLQVSARPERRPSDPGVP
jgi:hypothetical protein